MGEDASPRRRFSVIRSARYWAKQIYETGYAIASGMTGMLSQQLDAMVPRDHFDLHMEQVNQQCIR